MPQVRCACGSAPKVVLRSNVAGGRTRSCGCQASKGPKPRHGLSRTPEYDAWMAKEHCAGWADPRAFVRDIGPRPEGHALASDGPVLFCGSCEDCSLLGARRNARWRPADEVASSAIARAKDATSLRVPVAGASLTVREAAAALGVHRNTLYYRRARDRRR